MFYQEIRILNLVVSNALTVLETGDCMQLLLLLS